MDKRIPVWNIAYLAMIVSLISGLIMGASFGGTESVLMACIGLGIFQVAIVIFGFYVYVHGLLVDDLQNRLRKYKY